MLEVISRIWWQVRRAVVVGVVGGHLRTSIVRNSWMGIFNRTVQCRKRWVHVLKASQDCSSDDAQEQTDNVEDGGRPEQVVEVDDVLAAADIDVFIVATSDLHTVPTVVEITAEAGVAPDARRAVFTAEMRAFHLLSFLLGCLWNIVAAVGIEWFQINVSGCKDSIHDGTTKSCNDTKADEDNRCHEHLAFVLNQVGANDSKE